MKRTDKITTYGFFNVNKPSGIVSSTVVNKLKWLTGVPCGHMGTLDPLASGVLPVGVGNATRLFDYFLNKEKEYIAEFTFGVDSDTLDSTGNLVYGGHVPNETEISSVLPTFFGDVMQVPPKYSAKNVNGRRGYDLARAGIDFELPPKKVHIYGMELLGRVKGKEDTFRIKIRCGGGTYIRSLARDIALATGSLGVMSKLTRTACGVFNMQNGVTPQELFNATNPERYLIKADSVINFEKLNLTKVQAQKILDGVYENYGFSDGIYRVYNQGEFIGVGTVNDGILRINSYVR